MLSHHGPRRRRFTAFDGLAMADDGPGELIDASMGGRRRKGRYKVARMVARRTSTRHNIRRSSHPAIRPSSRFIFGDDPSLTLLPSAHRRARPMAVPYPLTPSFAASDHLRSLTPTLARSHRSTYSNARPGRQPSHGACCQRHTRRQAQLFLLTRPPGAKLPFSPSRQRIFPPLRRHRQQRDETAQPLPWRRRTASSSDHPAPRCRGRGDLPQGREERHFFARRHVQHRRAAQRMLHRLCHGCKTATPRSSGHPRSVTPIFDPLCAL